MSSWNTTAGKPSLRAQQNANNRATSFSGSSASCDADISSYCCFLTGSRENAPPGGSRPYFFLKESRLKYAQQPPGFADGYPVVRANCSCWRHARLESWNFLPHTNQWQRSDPEIAPVDYLWHPPTGQVFFPFMNCVLYVETIQ